MGIGRDNGKEARNYYSILGTYTENGKWKLLYHIGDMGGCQNSGAFLGTLNIRGRIIIGTQKGTTILTTTHTSAGA